jgi:hypothetical protein
MADCVAKVFLAFGRETLIQDRTRTSNNDLKEPTLRFYCYKFLFHRACLATFATQSAARQAFACPLSERSGQGTSGGLFAAIDLLLPAVLRIFACPEFAVSASQRGLQY